ncbi:unnamed protein product [Thelazia callipaeda]|uniref:Uncharacterized protein n=1 Tax=Thelazia callipaeda TaxID=103827 RepID=A0A0N5CR94_THECL|nr:unnamed protein product [Thelazia callipaeda]
MSNLESEGKERKRMQDEERFVKERRIDGRGGVAKEGIDQRKRVVYEEERRGRMQMRLSKVNSLSAASHCARLPEGPITGKILFEMDETSRKCPLVIFGNYEHRLVSCNIKRGCKIYRLSINRFIYISSINTCCEVFVFG